MKTISWMAWLATGVALAACNSKQDGATVGQQVDQTVASAQSAAADVKQSAQQGLNEAAQVSKRTSDEVAQKVNDAALTAAIKASIAKDEELSALRINVDTRLGHVSLYGSAPNEAAKQRAQALALAETGVTGVDNQLAIEKR